MSVSLKLSRGGVPGKPIYRVVASHRGAKRDGKFIEIIGQYNPMMDPAKITLKEDLVKKWLQVGARPSEVVASLIKKSFPGLLEGRTDHKKKKIAAARKKRKERAKSKGGEKAPKAAKAPKTKTAKKQ